MNGGGRACEVINLICLDEKRHCNIMPYQLKIRIIEKMDNIHLRAGEIVVEADHFMTKIK
jgi:hypothetical protein